MKTCKTCGAPLMVGSTVCGRCGTAVDAPAVRRCPVCGSEVMEGAVFCNKCGARLVPLTAGGRGGRGGKRTLVIARELQFQGLSAACRVAVNGSPLGEVPAGGAVRAAVPSDLATVEIRCAGGGVRQLVLRLGEQPRVSFKLQGPGTILETVQDAEVLERR